MYSNCLGNYTRHTPRKDQIMIDDTNIIQTLKLWCYMKLPIPSDEQYWSKLFDSSIVLYSSEVYTNVHTRCRVWILSSSSTLGKSFQILILQVQVVCMYFASKFTLKQNTPWRHHMEAFSALPALCVQSSPITGEFPSQRASNADLDVSLMWVRISY